MNGYQPMGADADEAEELEVLAPCNAVRRGSVEPCANWARIR